MGECIRRSFRYTTATTTTPATTAATTATAAQQVQLEVQLKRSSLASRALCTSNSACLLVVGRA